MTDVWGLRRSYRLLQGFRREATDPEAFYGLLAVDTVAAVNEVCEVRGARFIDVGGGPGYVTEAFRRAGAVSFSVEYEAGEAVLHGRTFSHGVIGDGQRLPVRAASVDIAYTSNVIEHVADPWKMLSELIRIVRPGGTVFVTFTNWYSPWGGHETSPWHYLGGGFAARRYERRYGQPPKNRYGATLFPLHVGQVLRWLRSSDAVQVVASYPRYYPRWTRKLVEVPGFRELLTWNLAVVLRRLEG
jgi:SAM-dependent methyltransferase